jgi:chromatin assembly factor 1 subunit A
MPIRVYIADLTFANSFCLVVFLRLTCISSKQQEEAEKDQRRREKEEAELKKQLSIQKQASIMERFLKRSKTSPPCKNDQSSAKAITSDSSSKKCGNMPDAVTLSMDSALSSNDVINGDEIRKCVSLSYYLTL